MDLTGDTPCQIAFHVYKTGNPKMGEKCKCGLHSWNFPPVYTRDEWNKEKRAVTALTKRRQFKLIIGGKS